MKFIGTVQKGHILLSPEQARQRTALLADMEGKVAEETIVKHYEAKSNQQIKTWWGLFATIVKTEFDDMGWDTSYFFNLDKPTGIGITTELLKEYMYSVVPIYDEQGKRVTMSKMNTKQMSKFFNDCRNWAATQWYINTPEPEKI